MSALCRLLCTYQAASASSLAAPLDAPRSAGSWHREHQNALRWLGPLWHGREGVLQAPTCCPRPSVAPHDGSAVCAGRQLRAIPGHRPLGGRHQGELLCEQPQVSRGSASPGQSHTAEILAAPGAAEWDELLRESGRAVHAASLQAALEPENSVLEEESTCLASPFCPDLCHTHTVPT